MSKNHKNRKQNPITCGYGCLAFLILIILFFVIAHEISTRIAERNIFLKTENLSLVKISGLISFHNDQKTAVIVNRWRFDNTPLEMVSQKGEIILRECDDFLAFVETSRVGGGLNINPKMAFMKQSRFSFYRVLKEMKKDKTYEVKTEFLGSIETNLYGEWNNRGRGKHSISISPDGKYIVMSAHGVNSRSLGKFRNKEVLLIWEVGDKVVEKDIVDRNGKKIPIIIKTEEELADERKEKK